MDTWELRLPGIQSTGVLFWKGKKIKRPMASLMGPEWTDWCKKWSKKSPETAPLNWLILRRSRPTLFIAADTLFNRKRGTYSPTYNPVIKLYDRLLSGITIIYTRVSFLADCQVPPRFFGCMVYLKTFHWESILEKDMVYYKYLNWTTLMQAFQHQLTKISWYLAKNGVFLFKWSFLCYAAENSVPWRRFEHFPSGCRSVLEDHSLKTQ